MERIAEFLRVSLPVYTGSYQGLFPDADEGTIRNSFDSVKLPVRATRGSAGYDFFTPVPITLGPGESMTVPTGIRVRMREDYALFLFPRSGLGFRYRLQLDNTVGVIDSDYYYSDNEGHILIRVTNDSKEERTLELKVGDAFAQGVFLPYGITLEDSVTAERNGGFGSTDRKEEKS